MKIHCNVEVCNRTMSCLLKRKSQRSILTICKQSDKNNLYIYLQTLQNKQGTKYKINDNIEQVFTKFINNGKATIRLKEPAHDLIIQSDAIQLRSFFHMLKQGLSKKIDLSSIPLISNLNKKNMCSMPNTKVVVKKKSEYPTLKGFPITTEELLLSGLDRKSFDRQILRLQNLRILNLSGNQITSLPKELGYLPHLQELDLSHNCLGKCILSKWVWLNQTAIKNSLHLLDIRDNLLTILPLQIGQLNALVNLKVGQNMLKSLPQNIGRLKNLKYLDISKNSLNSLPGSMKSLQLLFLDISDNPFANDIHKCDYNISVPSLIECSARYFLKSRRIYDSSLIPFTLVKYLDEAKYCCTCGNACFEHYTRHLIPSTLTNIANEIKMTLQETVLFDCYFCSIRCSQYMFF